MNINDVFPGPSNRPQHPDFWALSDIILQNDGKTEDAGFDLLAFINEMADSDSVVYMARQRAMRATPDLMLQILLAGMWIDAFTVGYRLAQRRTGG